ncbi:YceH family protein [Shewanella mesophila]|uniref:YceH family protein n=1 Tax=Shewanella mesophila TaxID=2864208 RepID=UPI001C659E18|nr:YceH family protein [Shewanella mesophila]QYJ87541.1 YceH family protein [Shewanella mesophila]
MKLTSHEARVIGCLLEKERTTPEQYPLSLNGLTLACNQKSSREPVVNYTESEVQATIDSLNKKRLISEQSGFGSRVVKYKHRFCNTEFSALQLSSAQVAIICLLLLRGAQTPGELRTRSNRLHAFSDVTEVEHALTALSEMTEPLVRQLPREPGKRECRFIELLSETSEQIQTETPSLNSATGHEQPQDSLTERVNRLEQEVAELKQLVSTLTSNI